jgi:hypothetical protein
MQRETAMVSLFRLRASWSRRGAGGTRKQNRQAKRRYSGHEAGAGKSLKIKGFCLTKYQYWSIIESEKNIRDKDQYAEGFL